MQQVTKTPDLLWLQSATFYIHQVDVAHAPECKVMKPTCWCISLPPPRSPKKHPPPHLPSEPTWQLCIHQPLQHLRRIPDLVYHQTSMTFFFLV